MDKVLSGDAYFAATAASGASFILGMVLASLYSIGEPITPIVALAVGALVTFLYIGAVYLIEDGTRYT